MFYIFWKLIVFFNAIPAWGNIRRVEFGGMKCWNSTNFSNIWNVCCSLVWIYSIFIWFYFTPCAFTSFESLQQWQLNKSHLPGALKFVCCQEQFHTEDGYSRALKYNQQKYDYSLLNLLFVCNRTMFVLEIVSIRKHMYFFLERKYC